MALVAVGAVMGDGYFEIAKHTWLAAYSASVAVAAIAFFGAVGVAGTFRATGGQEAATTAGSSR